MVTRRLSEAPGMTTSAIIWIVGILAIGLCAKSIAALGRHSPWTAAGWWFTVVYLIAAIVKASIDPALPAPAEYGALAVLTVAFIVAGIRDEAQAEPWWWPDHRGATRADKRHSL
jgi:hypothetical protein